MTDKQPEALLLADRLDLYATGDAHQHDIEQAAAELRRLHQSECEGWRYAKECEARATELEKALGKAAEVKHEAIDKEREAMMQLFTDPENQPTQHGTVTVEYMQREIEAEREACAKVCEENFSDGALNIADAIRARGQA